MPRYVIDAPTLLHLLANDVHCGSCGNACPIGEACLDGSCEVVGPPPTCSVPNCDEEPGCGGTPAQPCNCRRRPGGGTLCVGPGGGAGSCATDADCAANYGSRGVCLENCAGQLRCYPVCAK